MNYTTNLLLKVSRFGKRITRQISTMANVVCSDLISNVIVMAAPQTCIGAYSRLVKISVLQFNV